MVTVKTVWRPAIRGGSKLPRPCRDRGRGPTAATAPVASFSAVGVACGVERAQALPEPDDTTVGHLETAPLRPGRYDAAASHLRRLQCLEGEPMAPLAIPSRSGRSRRSSRLVSLGPSTRGIAAHRIQAGQPHPNFEIPDSHASPVIVRWRPAFGRT